MIAILMLPANIATSDLPKVKIFWDNYDAIISIHNITKKNLSRDTNHIIDMIMWRKFGNSSIFMWPEKAIFWGDVLAQVKQFGIGTR